MNEHKGWLWEERTGSSATKKKVPRETTASIKKA